MNCDKHTDREGTLAVELPSIGVRRYLCAECRAELDAAIARIPVVRKGRTYRTERVYAGNEGQFSWNEHIEI